MEPTTIPLRDGRYATVQEDHSGAPYVQLHNNDWQQLSQGDLEALLEIVQARRAVRDRQQHLDYLVKKREKRPA